MEHAFRDRRRPLGSAARVIATGAVLLTAARVAPAQGIAGRYPGDVGIASDPEVVFAADFEEATTAAVAARWDDARNLAGMALVADSAPGSAGGQALRMTSVIGHV